MYHYRKLKCLLLLMFAVVTANAQLEDGKVYNFVNIGNSSQSMVITSDNKATITATNTNSYDQLWYVSTNSDGSYSLRNLYNGYYLRSSNATSARWTMVKGDELDAQCMFYCTAAGSGYTLRAIYDKNDYGYMHYGVNNGGIVCWESSSAATQWTINEVSISSAELDANWEKLNTIDPDESTVKDYQAALDNLFSDKACTTPKKSLDTEEDIMADTDYQALPEGLQKMVLKVYLDDWAEDNYDSNKSAWDADYAKKYRVQMYEPYNEPECAASALGLNAHTNLNNPTGIFANSLQPLYVMVEGEIAEGAYLYLASYTGHGKLGGYANGTELKEGLNVIPSFADGNNYCINYVVKTFDTSDGKRGNDAKAYKLSDYDDLKIHIEGGYINGYWNKMGDYNQTGSNILYEPDTDEDWNYIEARATQTDVTVLGEYITLQFPLNEALNADGGTELGLSSYYNDRVSISASIDEWDNVMLWERLVLGVLDEATTKAEAQKSPYSDKDYVFEYTGADTDGYESGYGDYYNVHGLSFGTPSGYMYGSWDHCGYHYNTMQSIMVEMLTSSGAHWGPGHEIGHQHQKLLTVNGLTEVTNNLFSNVVLWYFGTTTSRVNGSALEHIANVFADEDADFFSTTSNVFITTQMYYKLFLYYHVLGHNPKFYPKLFEMLRQDPMTSGYEQQGSTTILHFYKKCCEAAGEDLTEFFRAYGFFRVMDNRLVGDYSNSVYTQTQADIDAAIAEVKTMAEANGWEENIAVLFINDDTGESIESYKGGTLAPYEEANSELGCYASFDTDAQADYTYSVSGNTVTMEGTGGVGFAIYNAEGEIIAFSDQKTFTVSEECAELIASGEAQFGVVNADNTETAPVNVLDTDDTAAKYTALGELLKKVSAIVSLEDDGTGKKVGYYRTESLTALKAAYTSAQTAYDSQTTASYASVYEALNQAYVDLSKDDHARIGIVEGNTYRLVNKLYETLSMSIASDSLMIGETTDASSEAQQWYFEGSGTAGRYYIKNKSTSKYPGNVVTSTQLKANATSTADAYAYELRDMGNGLWALVGSTGLHCDASNNIVGWTASADASQWYITAVTVDATAESRYELEALVQKTEELMDEVGSVSEGTEKIALTESNYYCNATYTASDNNDKFTSYDVLKDDDHATFLHTDYSSNAPDEDHYIRIDLGSGNELSLFNINYTTRGSGNVCAPTKVAIEVSNDVSEWITLCNIEDGLPTDNDKDWTIEKVGDGTPYRYIRMRVYETSTGQKANEHYFFVLSEFGISKITYAETLHTEYASIASGTLLATFKAHMAAQGVLDAAVTADYESAYNTLKTQYEALLAARDAADAAALTTLQGQLSTLITNTNSLIGECGTVTYTPATSGGEVELQTTEESEGFYLSTNAPEEKEGAIEYLLDDDNSSFFHSAWSWDVAATHYLQVDMGDGYSLKEFTFSYQANKGPYPYTIEVYGSATADFASKELLGTFSKDDAENALPTSANTLWTSTNVSSETAYRYFRFEVTNSGASGINATPEGEYCFVMSKFVLTAIAQPESYDVALGDNAGGATEELMIAAHKEMASAESSLTMATTEAQLQKAIDRLQADYDALSDAKNSTTYTDYTIQVTGGNGNGGVVYDGANYTTTLKAPTTLTVDQLTAIALDGYVAKSVTLEGTTITVIYNKVYTVQVVGLDGQGGVQFGDGSYNHGQELNALNLEVGNLTAIVLEGYVADIALGDATITVTYKKIYTVNISGVTDQGGVMLGGVSYTDEVHVLGTLEVNQLSAVEVDGYKAFISVEGTAINVVYKMIYYVEVVGADGGVTFEDVNYASDAEVYALSAIEVSQLTAVEVSGYVGTVTLDDRTIRVAYCKLIQDLSELRNYKAYHIRAKSGEGYFAWNSSITDTYVSLRGATDWSKNPNGITSNETVANKYKEVVTLSDKTVAWQIIKEGDSYYLYQPEKKAYVTRNGRNYLFTADKTALDGIRQNSEDYVGTFGIHAGGDYSDESSYFACIVINESEIAVRNWYYTDHGAILQIIENPYVYALDYAVEVVGNVEGRVEFEDVEYSHGESISATELLTASDLMVKSIGGYEHKIEVNKDNATITITYTAIDKTELINLITNTEALVNSASSHLGSSLNVTQALIDATNERLTTARSVRDDSSVNKEEYDATLAELQEVHLQLQTAIAYATLPVQLTFDASSPVTYKIKIARANTPVLAYDESSSMVAVTTFELGNKSHGWYFMATTDGKVRIMPYHELNTTLALSANDFTAGNSKVKGMPIGEEGYTQEWTISNTNMNEANINAGWYNITTINPSNTETTWYFSNHGGVANKMGFYNDANDDGSRFKFEKITFDKSEAYYTLYNYYMSDAKVASNTITGNDAVGYYPVDAANAYNTAYGTATAVLENTTATDDEYTSAYNALVVANEALPEINMPEEGKYYRFVSVVKKNDETNSYANVYANPEDNKMYWAADKATGDATAMWTFVPLADGKFAVTNLHTGSSINTFINYNPSPLGETAGEVSIVSLSLDGQIGIKCGDRMMHAQGGGAVVHWETGADDGSAWRIVEVEDMSLVNFAVNVGEYGHTSLYLNYPVTIPDAVKAYIIDGTDIDIDADGVGTLKLTQLTGNVLPAQTAVIVEAPQGEYSFSYTTVAATDDVESNLLTGSAYVTYREAEEGHNYYIFGVGNTEGVDAGVVGLYKNFVEYTAAGVYAEEGTEDATHYKMSANKVLFDWSNSGQQVTSFRFSVDGDATGIDNIGADGNAVIYDLYGRRILEVVSSGIYIINGEKRYVHVK